MKKFIYSFLIIIFPFKGIISETNDTTFIHGDSLKTNNYQIFKGWDYSPGDDSLWAAKTFNSSGWKVVDCRMFIDSVKNNWKGFGWFRTTIKIDSSLISKTVAMTLNHYGASELYINGKLKNRYGIVSQNGNDEKIFYSNSKPIIVIFDSSDTYLFAVKYSNHLLKQHPYLYPRFRDEVGFFATLKDLNKGLDFYGITQANETSLAAWIVGIFLSISVIYLLLFLFYSKQKEYLYYTIFTFSIALSFLNNALDNIVSSNLFYFLGFTFFDRFFALALFLSLLAFIYQIFYRRMLKLFRYLLAIGIGIYIIQLITSYEDLVRYIYFAIVFISSIEILRVVILAIKSKKNNAWVIGAGVSVFVLVILLLLIYIRLFGGQLNSDYIIFILLFSIPLSMSVYLARSSSQTNKNLETQLANVKQLSKEAVEHEKKTSKLELESQLIRLENERKSKELEEARQLQLSMLPKEIPSLPHLEIAVYMKTATEVGGDYYDFNVGLDGTLTVAIGDATGHGMQAGTIVSMVKALFASTSSKLDMKTYFNQSSDALKEIELGRLMMAFMMMKINNRNIEICNAGMPPLFIYRKQSNKVEEILLKGMPLGAIKNFPYEIINTELSSGDTLLSLSDGLPELKNDGNKQYGYERIKDSFRQAAEKQPEEIINHLKEEGSRWANDKDPDDDVTFVVIKIKG